MNARQHDEAAGRPADVGRKQGAHRGRRASEAPIFQGFLIAFATALLAQISAPGLPEVA